jgi:hypothetical protein
MRDWKDRLGIFASAACAVHCAATPILVATLPTLKLTEWMADPRFHQIAAVICCGLVAIAIIPAALRFRDLRLLSLASTGLGLILTAAFAMPESCCSTAASTPQAHAHVDSHSHAGHDHSHDDHAHADTETQTAQSSTLLMAGLGVAHPWMTPIGGLLLIAAHGLNMKRRWKASCEKAHCCGGTCSEEQVIKLPELEAAGSSTLARAS